MKKLIIIGHEPLTIRLNKIFCIDQLIKSGVCVEYWDLSQLIFPGINISDKLVHPYIKHICKICELENELSLNNIAYNSQNNLLQVLAFALVICVALLLFVIRGDLLNSWQLQLPQRTPNYFALNIPAEVMPRLSKFLSDNKITSDNCCQMFVISLSRLSSSKWISCN